MIQQFQFCVYTQKDQKQVLKDISVYHIHDWTIHNHKIKQQPKYLLKQEWVQKM